MKIPHLFQYMSVTFVVVLLCSMKCQDPRASNKMYVDIQNERGVWGCGIPCPGINLPSMEETCNKPNGICHLAQIFPPIDIHKKEKQYTMELLGDNVLSFDWVGTLQDSKEELIKLKDKLDSSVFNENFELIRKYINTHFYIPNDLEFTKEQLDIINSQTGKRYRYIKVHKGEYPISSSSKAHNFKVKITAK